MRISQHSLGSTPEMVIENNETPVLADRGQPHTPPVILSSILHHEQLESDQDIPPFIMDQAYSTNNMGGGGLSEPIPSPVHAYSSSKRPAHELSPTSMHVQPNKQRRLLTTRTHHEWLESNNTHDHSSPLTPDNVPTQGIGRRATTPRSTPGPSHHRTDESRRGRAETSRHHTQKIVHVPGHGAIPRTSDSTMQGNKGIMLTENDILTVKTTMFKGVKSRPYNASS
jgi:hypothetical protein